MQDVDRFLVFAEVVESGSFSRAAERLGLAKSSVSKSTILGFDGRSFESTSVVDVMYITNASAHAIRVTFMG